MQHSTQHEENAEEIRVNNKDIFEDLSDYENMVDDTQVEADYFVDRAEPAAFIPEIPGEDKSTMLIDREELFDFNLEVEPIL